MLYIVTEQGKDDVFLSEKQGEILTVACAVTPYEKLQRLKRLHKKIQRKEQYKIAVAHCFCELSQKGKHEQIRKIRVEIPIRNCDIAGIHPFCKVCG